MENLLNFYNLGGFGLIVVAGFEPRFPLAVAAILGVWHYLGWFM